MIKVIHIITGLSVGGAENMLFKLVSNMDRTEFAPEVISLSGIGPIGEKMRAQGIPVRALNMRPGMPNPALALRLAGWIRKSRPQVVQTWLHHADLIGGLATRLAGRTPLAWNIRHSNLDPATIKRQTILIGRACAKLSHTLPQRIVCCSEAGREEHARLGYAADKLLVIPNGFDLTAYHPSETARAAIRAELGMPTDAPLIGLIGRFHPMKDHATFVQAAALLHALRPEVHFVCCGEDITWQNDVLADAIKRVDLCDRFHLLGQRRDIPQIAAALTIGTLCSLYGEGFPNVIGEAMACGVPCVVTDVGDSVYIIGKTGRVVPLRSPEALCAAWQEILDLSPEAAQRSALAARARVEAHFALGTVVGRYQKLYKDMSSA
jgi:glycosyltransferase involved in cell wall biosynthesis